MDTSCMAKTDGYSFNGGSVAGQAAYESYHGTTLNGGGRRRSARRSAKRSARRSAKRTNRRVSRRTARRSVKRSAKLQGRRAVYREVEKSEGQQGGFFSSLFN